MRQGRSAVGKRGGIGKRDWGGGEKGVEGKKA